MGYLLYSVQSCPMTAYTSANYDKIVIKSSFNRGGAAIGRRQCSWNPNPRLVNPLCEVGDKSFPPQPAETDGVGNGGVGFGGERGGKRERKRQRRLHCCEKKRSNLGAELGLEKKRERERESELGGYLGESDGKIQWRRRVQC